MGSVLALTLAAPVAWGASRVVSLDQCADQFALALSPRSAIAGLSMRARDGDSYLRGAASGVGMLRADIESVLAARPDVVLRYWGGSPRLLAELRRRGVRVVTIEDAVDFAGVAANVRRVSGRLGRADDGERLVGSMIAKLNRAAGAWRGRGAVYLTPGGATAGAHTLVDAILQAAGLRNLGAGAGFHELSMERLAADPPRAVVRGFFDLRDQARQPWSLGRHEFLRRMLRERGLVSVKGSLLGCPAWFAADAALDIAMSAPPTQPAAAP